jgi:thymidylate synthase
MDAAVIAALRKNRDSRRVFWPIFRPEDAIRAGAPTRIPCSLGYQFVLRELAGDERLLLFYLSRSVDFDTFWLSDLWLAHKMQVHVAGELSTNVGYLSHFIISFHSFAVNDQEIY